MEKFLKEKHSTNKIIQCVVAIFLFHLFWGWVNRNYLGSHIWLKSLSHEPRTAAEIYAEMWWNFLGHGIFSVYFSLFYSMVTKGKGVIEGIRLGLLVGFFLDGLLFMEWPYLHFAHQKIEVFFYQLIFFLILPTLDGILASFILKKN